MKRLIKLWLMICVFCPVVMYSQLSGTDKKVLLDCRNLPLRSVLGEMTDKYSVNFIYNDDLVNDVKITCKIKTGDIEKAVGEVLQSTNIGAKFFDGKSIVLYKKKQPLHESYKAVVMEKNLDDDKPRTDAAIVFTRPRILTNIKPEYPDEAIHKRIEGDVVVKFLITSEGIVTNAFAVSSSGSETLDEAAVNYIQELKFSPAKTNNKPHNIWMSMRIKYLIENN